MSLGRMLTETRLKDEARWSSGKGKCNRRGGRSCGNDYLGRYIGCGFPVIATKPHLGVVNLEVYREVLSGVRRRCE